MSTNESTPARRNGAGKGFTQEGSQGKVIAVGPGRRTDKGELIPVELSEGDKVLYGKYSGTEVNIGGEDYLIVKETDVLAVLS